MIESDLGFVFTIYLYSFGTVLEQYNHTLLQSSNVVKLLSMITDAIKNFPKQFEYEPEVVNGEKIGEFESAVIGGMGGSGLVVGILRALKVDLDIVAHHEYGLPTFLKHDKENNLYIAISYSGNTEETLDFFSEAIKKNLRVAAISIGGRLLEIAERNNVPYIKLPDTGIEPRMALGFMVRAILKLLGEDELFDETGKLSESLSGDLEKEGKTLAEKLAGKTPVIYSSRRNQTLAYNWKIKFNETGKIPAFYNTFPELNHNEMTGFDVTDSTSRLSKNMHFIILKDSDDDRRVSKRMDVLEKLYVDRKLEVTVANLIGRTRGERIFNSLVLADWTAYSTAEKYGVEPEKTPMIEEFKKLIQ